MDIAEKRSELLKRISLLDEHRFEEIYNELLSIIQHNENYRLTDEENMAIDQALNDDESERRLTKNQIISEAKARYPNLKFK